MKKTEMKKIAKKIVECKNETIITPSIFYGTDNTSMSFTTYDKLTGRTYEYYIDFTKNQYHRTYLSSACLHDAKICSFKVV